MPRADHLSPAGVTITDNQFELWEYETLDEVYAVCICMGMASRLTLILHIVSQWYMQLMVNGMTHHMKAPLKATYFKSTFVIHLNTKKGILRDIIIYHFSLFGYIQKNKVSYLRSLIPYVVYFSLGPCVTFQYLILCVASHHWTSWNQIWLD